MKSELVPWHMAVLIPARNEEELLPGCLASVARACRLLPAGVSTDVVVVSDGSTDRTMERAAAVLEGQGTVLGTEAGSVGAARALAARAALERYPGQVSRCWLANTDADCEVPATWLLEHLRSAQEGHAAVAGIVDVEDFSEHAPWVRERFRETYRIHADGSHPHVHGANLGVRADAYLRAGGWPPLPTAEDHDLWRRLQDSGAVPVSDARLWVVTSGRRVGRAPFGFAGALSAHNEPVTA